MKHVYSYIYMFYFKIFKAGRNINFLIPHRLVKNANKTVVSM